MDNRASLNASRNTGINVKTTPTNMTKSVEGKTPKGSAPVSRKPSAMSMNRSILSGDSAEMMANMDVNNISLNGKQKLRVLQKIKYD